MTKERERLVWVVAVAWWATLVFCGITVGAALFAVTDRPTCAALCQRNAMRLRFKCEHPDMLACLCDKP